MAEEKKSASEDSVKLFVGQVPKHMTEAQLLELFQEFALVDEVNVIKDKVSRASRGCCFVMCPSREEADKAISAYHNKLTLPGASSPLQVKYANGELERLEHKLFIGMLPRNVSAEEVSDLFSKYGTIKDIHILRGVQTSKGCAFLKYETKEEAMEALNALNGKHKMEGCSVSLVVKWADTEKERQTRRAQKAMSNMSNTDPQSPSLFRAALPIGYLPIGYQGQGPYGALPYRIPFQFHNMIPPSINQGNHISPEVSPRNYGMSTVSYPGYLAAQGIQYPMAYPRGMMPHRPFSAPSYGGQIEGPADANLFIYHLPEEYGDEDLANAFRPFGQVLSAKVFVDKATGCSKCFGFVSYESPESAQSAISKMHGHTVGSNKLKVQLKRDNRQG